MPGSNCSRPRFISHSKFVWTVYIPGTQRKRTKICQFCSYKHLLWQQKQNFSTDSVMKGKVKTCKKDKEKNNSKWSKNNQGNVISEM